MDQQNQFQIGIRLAALRKEHGFSQEALAERLAVSRQAISKWERGESLPDTDNLIALSRLYGITLDALINGTPSEETAQDSEESDRSEESEAPDKAELRRRRRMLRKQRREQEEEEEEYAFITYHAPLSSELLVLQYLARYSPILFTAVFLLGGFCTGAWYIFWTPFLLIPVLHSLYQACLEHRLSHFAYPIFITFIFLVCGFLTGMWHPMWVLYITIPIFYTLAAAVDRATRRREEKEEAEAEADRDRKGST